MALTDTAIKALKPRSTRYVVTDGQGLVLEIHPTGNMTWRYRYRLKGKAEKASIGRYPEISLKAARQKRNDLAALVALDQSPAQEKQRAKQALSKNTTVKEFGERYFVDIASRDLKEPKHIRRYLDKEIYPELGAKPMCDVSIADVQKIVFRKKDNGREAAAAAIRNLLKRLFDYAVARQVTATNPALALPMRFITKAKARERNLSPNEIRIYLRTLYASNIRRQFKLGLHLILLTMARKGELLAAKWSDVRFDEAEWHVPVENSKTGKPHVVYLSSQAVGLFKELQVLAGGSELVMPGRGSLTKPFAHNSLNHALKGVTFSIEAFTIHDMRRTASTRLHEAGFESDVIEKALNHTIGGVRGVYNKAEYAQQRRDMLQFWADYVAGLASEDGLLTEQFGSPYGQSVHISSHP